MDMDNSVGIDCGSGGHGMREGGQRGKSEDNCKRITIFFKKVFKKKVTEAERSLSQQPAGSLIQMGF